MSIHWNNCGGPIGMETKMLPSAYSVPTDEEASDDLDMLCDLFCAPPSLALIARSACPLARVPHRFRIRFRRQPVLATTRAARPTAGCLRPSNTSCDPAATSARDCLVIAGRSGNRLRHAAVHAGKQTALWSQPALGLQPALELQHVLGLHPSAAGLLATSLVRGGCIDKLWQRDSALGEPNQYE